MALRARLEWQGVRATTLAALDTQFAAAGGAVPPDPVLEDALLRGYVVLLAAQFQGFCRDLYSECVSAVVATVPLAMQTLVQRQCNSRCELAGANSRYESIRADFERFNLSLTTALDTHSPAAAGWVTTLGHMNAWRNTVAHGNPVAPPHGGPLSLASVRMWRAACDNLAGALEVVMYHHLSAKTGAPPW